jgi:hypothetical protein
MTLNHRSVLGIDCVSVMSRIPPAMTDRAAAANEPRVNLSTTWYHVRYRTLL